MLRTLMITTALLAATACEGTITAELDDEEPFDEEAELNAGLQLSPQDRTVTTGTCTNTFNFEAELLIRDLAVVEDPVRTTGTGVWTFGHLVTALAGTRDPSAIAREWLETWRASPQLAGEVVRGNASTVDDLLIAPWRADGFALAAAPFRLLAIALRPDTPGGAELRFVYSAVSPAPARAALPMTVAFEYRVTPAFLRRWHAALRPLALGTPAYRDALAALTEEAIRDAAGINGSSLAQLRTNEAAIDAPWDLREFRLEATAGGTLARARLTGQPKVKLDGDARLAQGVTPAMETYSAVIPSKNFAWTIPGATDGERFRFAMTTCAGCHARETRTSFVHIEPREAGKRAQLSSFLLSRTCTSGDDDCKELERTGQFNDPIAPSHRFTVQDDRMAALNAVLAAANDCE